jgi:hypothetical protein
MHAILPRDDRKTLGPRVGFFVHNMSLRKKLQVSLTDFFMSGSVSLAGWQEVPPLPVMAVVHQIVKFHVTQ